MSESNKTNEQLVRELIEAFSKLKEKMEDPNYVHLEASMNQLMVNQREMKEDLSDLKKMFLNPYDGAIVEIRKNTEFRNESVEKESEFAEIIEEHKQLVAWKKMVGKVFVAILGSAGAIVTWIITELLK